MPAKKRTTKPYGPVKGLAMRPPVRAAISLTPEEQAEIEAEAPARAPQLTAEAQRHRAFAQVRDDVGFWGQSPPNMGKPSRTFTRDRIIAAMKSKMGTDSITVYLLRYYDMKESLDIISEARFVMTVGEP